MNPALIDALVKLVRDRLVKPKNKFPDAAEKVNPVFAMGRLEDILDQLEYVARYDNIQEAAEALARGCTWLDYDGKKWTK